MLFPDWINFDLKMVKNIDSYNIWKEERNIGRIEIMWSTSRAIYPEIEKVAEHIKKIYVQLFEND